MKKTQKKIRVWITKYALTQGVYESEVELCGDVDPSGNMVKGSSVFDIYRGRGREWHDTKDGAVAYADRMRRKKIELLKGHISRLEAMRF